SVSCAVTVSMSGRKAPLFFITKGKTERSHKSLTPAVKRPHILTHSPNGWMTTELMLEYIKQVLTSLVRGRRSALVLDDFDAHTADSVREALHELGVEMI